MPAGTAQLMIDGHDTGNTHAVSCLPLGWLTILTIGSDTSGVTAYVSNEHSLVAKSVSIHDLGGFTGSYQQGLGGNSAVRMTGRTYDITGVAHGFTADRPSARTTGTFAIKVAC